MINITALNKTYKSKKRHTCQALCEINLTLPDSGLAFLLGKSGSGKSTLLNLIGGLDSADSGKIEVDGNDISTLKGAKLSSYRNGCVGFVFQDFHLIDELTVYENVALALDLQKVTNREQVNCALKKVALDGYGARYPRELSGGERQRVAIARSIVKNPRIILADEPTGNLDEASARSVLDILKEISQDSLVFVVSHNAADARLYADRILELAQGRIISDKSRNPDFSDQLIEQSGQILYPEGAALTDSDIAFLNEHTEHRPLIVKCTDQYIPTVPQEPSCQKTSIPKYGLLLRKRLKLSGKFLKRKLTAIFLYSFIVTAIMVIMALAQTFTGFDFTQVMETEMNKTDADSVYLTKALTERQKMNISQLGMVSDSFPEIYDSDIQQFADAGCGGRIYEVLKYNLNASQSRVSAGMATGLFENSPYILEPLGTMVVDEAFLEEKFDGLFYLARAEEFHPTGVIITDYIADVIILSDQVTYADSYESLIGEFHWGTKEQYSCVSRGYINGIIDTGYKYQYRDIFDRLEIGNINSAEELFENETFLQFVEDVHSKYGFCYSLNPNFREDALTDPAWETVWHYSLQFDDRDLVATSIPQVRKASFYGIPLRDDEVLMELTAYNRAFGTEYTSATIGDFQPHSTQLRHYKYFDSASDEPLFSKEIKIAGLFVSGQNNMSGTLIASQSIYDAFAKDHIYTTGLYFADKEYIPQVLDIAGELGFQKNLVVIESVQTVAKAVEAFVPIFALIGLVLCIAVVFILMNFASKMISCKMSEIGILKALGAGNGMIGTIFGLQILLIVLLTGILSTIGYYFLVGLANDLLVESMQLLVSSRIVLDLEFLAFDTQVAVRNGILILLLALIAFILPMIRIRALDPVRIIKTKE